ncbi:MAG: MBL fold metallo-hydrolase [Isosphaeraceae bacterium]
MAVQFAVLGSGSRGNATLIRAGGAGLLLDVGIGPRALESRLQSVNADWSQIASALLTHTHGDHVDNGTLHRMANQRVALYCHEGHHGELTRLSGFQALITQGLVRHYDDRPFLSPAGLWVEPLELRHDSGPTYGFRIEGKVSRNARTVAIGYLADTGSWSTPMADLLADVDLLGVEFNHDEEMQRQSNRPHYLVARNLGDRGHLSNLQGAGFVSEVLSRSRGSALRHLVLLHLSENCNTPGLALRSAHQAIRESGRRVKIHAALQELAHPVLWIPPGRRRTSTPGGPHGTPARARPTCPSILPATCI